ncbi:hypothetical protein Ddye_021611 [Dipteronia dyeriana]|uniref:Retrotransposon gag domain-containing protein n=1 Tax=Dipteronia dyeriana TaxID=168575 RepID=A0AAD9U2T0_9ROSI|nr:hypothetical protein Ddye_021611 [Dipteronia dyeriana]
MIMGKALGCEHGRDSKALLGVRNAMELENLLRDMEQYFKAARIPVREQLNIINIYRGGDVKLLLHIRLEDDLSAGRPKINTWESLKKELKDQFLSYNTNWLARENLKKLKLTGSVQDYVNEFSSLMLEILNMSKEDKLFNFT